MCTPPKSARPSPFLPRDSGALPTQPSVPVFPTVPAPEQASLPPGHLSTRPLFVLKSIARLFSYNNWWHFGWINFIVLKFRKTFSLTLGKFPFSISPLVTLSAIILKTASLESSF